MISIVKLSSKRGTQKILQEIALNVENGEILAILGPSGAGKTSLLRLIAGLDMPTQGEIRIEGQIVKPLAKLTTRTSHNISMIFQDLALWPHMTVFKNVEFVVNEKRLRNRVEVREKVERLLSMMSLSEYRNRYPDELSGGEKQRLAIARALVSEPKCLLMDEPFSNLDDLLKRELLDITLSLKKKSAMTILYVTHNIDEAFFLADRIAVINRGRIVKIWGKEEIKGLSKQEIHNSCFGEPA
ncbi:MAG: ATP-binding cassette domain-containing protein [Candidatus Scalindua sp. AMX11]|nr:ABC transporter ATP-binding protein [Planctomycetota bacterium]RZV61019.1 MAG: ABC transporter ATP-binding protein [Candidatus Scalindua sp. SCAELEC01]TDE63168.1 MAG: ATP-binding cassette domain-containing protein [Candidatus Scalindua sp. AMX11]